MKTKEEIKDRNQLIEQNLGLVRKVAHQFVRCSPQPYDELYSVGVFGLIKAAERFKSDLGTAFGSFAVPYIKGEIQHYLRDHGSVIRRPRNRSDAEKYGRVLSLDAAFRDSDITLMDQLVGGNLMLDEVYALKHAISQLDYPDKGVITLVCLQGFSHKEVAKLINVSQMTVTRYLNRALVKLKYALLGKSPTSDSTSESYFSKKPMFSAAELALLKRLSETKHLDELVQEFQATAVRYGWPVRSYEAIKSKLSRLGLSQRAVARKRRLSQAQTSAVSVDRSTASAVTKETVKLKMSEGNGWLRRLARQEVFR